MRSVADDLDLREVRAFVAVVDAGSFLEAAQRLALSQPAISQQVQRVEASLGVPLLVRDRGGCRPTPAGAACLPHARRLLQAGERARHALVQDRLSLGASTNIGVYHLPGLLAGWSESDVLEHLDLQVWPHAPLLDALTAGQIDLALTEWWDERPGFVARAWHREPIVAIVGPQHRLAAAKSVSLERLFSDPLVGGEPGTGTATLLRQAFDGRIVMPPVRHIFGSTEGVKRAVAAGLGVSLVLASSCRDEVASGALRAIRLRDGPLHKTFHLVAPADAPPDRRTDALWARLCGPVRARATPGRLRR